MSEGGPRSAVSKAKRGRLRASRACDRCHGRKVRCDITSTVPGNPCTNCRLDKTHCATYTGFRARSLRIPAENPQIEDTPVLAISTKEIEDAASQHCLQLISAKEQDHCESSLTADQFPVLDPLRSLDFRITDLWMPSGRKGPDFSDTESCFSKRSESFKMPWLRFGDISNSRGLDDHLPFSYYDFLKFDNLSAIQPGDARFLEFNGSLHVPVKHLLDKFMNEYFLHVHPGLPMLDEHEFWTTYESSGGEIEKSRKISLFLFQAMLFTSCTFVSTDVLRACGFENTREARVAFYRRAKSIFDLNMGHASCSNAQGALLLTYYVSNTDPLTNTYWLTVAIQNAKIINAQLYNKDRILSSKARLTKKRLWWCCILRDRVLPLGVRRPIQITREHFDFMNNRMTEEDMQDQLGWSRVYQPETQKILIKIFVALCELAVPLTDIIMTVYPLDGSSPVPPNSADELKIIEAQTVRQKRELLAWFSKFDQLASPQTDPERGHLSVTLFTKLLYMYYHSARLALCHYEILVIDPWTSSREDHAQRLETSKSEVRIAIDAMNEDLQTLTRLKVAQYLPISAMAYTALPLLLSAMDLKLSSNSNQMDFRRRQLELHVDAMKMYRGKYDGTEHVTEVIEKILADAESQTGKIGLPPSPKSADRNVILSRNSKDWCDVFTQHPKIHMRLTLAIDLSFAKGRFPQDSDFPAGYRATQINESLTVGNGHGESGFLEQNPTATKKSLFATAWAMGGRKTGGTVTPAMSDDTHKNLNLDFADLFGEQSMNGGRGWVEDDVQDLFDYSVPS